MNTYSYVAKNAESKRVTGKVEGRDERHAARILRESGLVVISIKPEGAGIEIPFLSGLSNRVTSNDIVTFTQQLSTMINSGLPLTDALELLKIQSKPGLATVVAAIIQDVQGGSSLGDSMAKHPKVFSSVYVALVKSGEASGKLDEVLDRLAKNEEKRREFRSKTKGAMVYPAIVVTAMMIVVTVMMVFVVPQMTDMYKSFGAELPFITQVLIAMSNVVRTVWWLILLLIIGAVMGIKQWRTTHDGRLKTDELMLKIPIFGQLRAQTTMTEFAMTLSLLVGAGISILEALDIVTRAVDNMVYQEALAKVMKGVEKGMPMASMLARQRVFPALLAQMVSVGEETGELEAVLQKVAHYFEMTSEQTIKNLTTAMEPMIMIVLGVVVGFIVLAIITPIYKITELF